MIARAYRIYDKTSKQMLYPEQLMRMGVFLDPKGQAVQVKKSWLGAVIKVLKNIVVMYQTGLATNTGEPIWEGDILDVDVPNEWGSCTVARGYMQWDSHNGKWYIHIPNPPATVPNGNSIAITGAMMVGDIYQSPELLKV